MTPEHDGVRAPEPRPPAIVFEILEHQRTAEARIEAASVGLAKAILGDGDPTVAAISALTLLDAALRDLRAVRA